MRGHNTGGRCYQRLMSFNSTASVACQAPLQARPRLFQTVSWIHRGFIAGCYVLRKAGDVGPSSEKGGRTTTQKEGI
jgi:hypothetical protein